MLSSQHMEGGDRRITSSLSSSDALWIKGQPGIPESVCLKKFKKWEINDNEKTIDSLRLLNNG